MIPIVLWLLHDFLSLKNYVNAPSKSKKQKSFCWHLEDNGDTKITGSRSACRSISQRNGSADPEPHPDPYQNFMDPQHCLSGYSRVMVFIPLANHATANSGLGRIGSIVDLCCKSFWQIATFILFSFSELFLFAALSTGIVADLKVLNHKGERRHFVLLFTRVSSSCWPARHFVRQNISILRGDYKNHIKT